VSLYSGVTRTHSETSLPGVFNMLLPLSVMETRLVSIVSLRLVIGEMSVLLVELSSFFKRFSLDTLNLFSLLALSSSPYRFAITQADLKISALALAV